MSSASYSPIPANFKIDTFADCTGYKGFSDDMVSMGYNQSVCTLNSTRNFDAIGKCCSDVLNGTLQSVGGSSITFCTLPGNGINETAYFDCFKKIPLPVLPAGQGYTNLTTFVASELGGCGICGPKKSSSLQNYIVPKAGIAIVGIVFGAVLSSL